MFQLSPVIIAFTFLLTSFSTAQFPPPVTYDAVLKSPTNPNVTVSYKEPEPGTCVTAFPHQKQYTGYVHLPPFTLEPYQQNYSINTFFWFIEARDKPETAPLTIWLNGGPGSSSMLGLFTENGPCEVVQLPDGTYGTQPRLWGWDRTSNMLFIDQPTQTGFSYDEVSKGYLDLTEGAHYTHGQPPVDEPSWHFLYGTFSSGKISKTQNTTLIAASASWHFLQSFLTAFPQYNPGTRPDRNTTEPTGINLFGESYAGMYVPAFAEYYESQNNRRGTANPTSTLEIKLASVGIINGVVDMHTQADSQVRFAAENDYGIQALGLTEEHNALRYIGQDCRRLIANCRESVAKEDPSGEGDENPTNALCQKAQATCDRLLLIALSSGRSPYDIRDVDPSAHPSSAFLEYLNTAAVQQSIGAPVNFTMHNNVVNRAFHYTGDGVRESYIPALVKLVRNGVRVAMVYGDADLICNWMGGEWVARDIIGTVGVWEKGPGYADIIVNSSYVGGHVLQAGNFSFSRIFDAGHTVPLYQPETAFTGFTRIVEGTDIGMGREVNLTRFQSQGPSRSVHPSGKRREIPEQEPHTCWIRNIEYSCTFEEKLKINRGEGAVRNGIWYAQAEDYRPLSSVAHGGKPGSLPPAPPTTASATTSTIPLTGVYTASETPTPTSGAISLRSPLFRVQRRQIVAPPAVPPPAVVTQVVASDHAKQRKLRKSTKKLGRALIATIATLGSLLLLSLIALAVLCLSLLRRPRKHSTDREVEAPAATPNGRRPTMVEGLARRPYRPAAPPAPVAPSTSTANPPRRPSANMDPIPETEPGPKLPQPGAPAQPPPPPPAPVVPAPAPVPVPPSNNPQFAPPSYPRVPTPPVPQVPTPPPAPGPSRIPTTRSSIP